MIESWPLFAGIFAFFSLLAFAIYFLGNRHSKDEPSKTDMYKSGEPTAPDSEVGPDNFYNTIKETLRIKSLQDIQSGSLSAYVQWIIVGCVIIVALLLILL
jgi:hypothetical protein